MEIQEVIQRLNNVFAILEPKHRELFATFYRGRRGPPPRMPLVQIIAIAIHYHYSGRFANFKDYYRHLQRNHRDDFPHLISYNRYVEWKPRLTEILEVLVRLMNHEDEEEDDDGTVDIGEEQLTTH